MSVSWNMYSCSLGYLKMTGREPFVQNTSFSSEGFCNIFYGRRGAWARLPLQRILSCAFGSASSTTGAIEAVQVSYLGHWNGLRVIKKPLSACHSHLYVNDSGAEPSGKAGCFHHFLPLRPHETLWYHSTIHQAYMGSFRLALSWPSIFWTWDGMTLPCFGFRALI